MVAVAIVVPIVVVAIVVPVSIVVIVVMVAIAIVVPVVVVAIMVPVPIVIVIIIVIAVASGMVGLVEVMSGIEASASMAVATGEGDIYSRTIVEHSVDCVAGVDAESPATGAP